MENNMTKYKFKLGTSVIAQSDDKKHIAMGEVEDTMTTMTMVRHTI